jgi:hypothetical protein
MSNGIMLRRLAITGQVDKPEGSSSHQSFTDLMWVAEDTKVAVRPVRVFENRKDRSALAI